MQDISKCFPYKKNNYREKFISLDVIEAICEFAKENPIIEKIYAKGSIIYGTMIEGSDIDHLRIKTTKPLTITEKIILVDALEQYLEKYHISKLQRIKENDYIRVFYDYIELIDYPRALTIKDEIYPNPHILTAKNKKRLVRKIYKRAYKYSEHVDEKWINKYKERIKSL